MQLEITNLLDKIELYENTWLIVEDGIPYTFNPSIDTLILVEEKINKKKEVFITKTKVNTKDAHLAFLDLRTYLFKNHNHILKVRLQNNKERAIALSIENNNIRTPNEIKLCTSFLKNINDWKFTLAHEVGHFVDYFNNPVITEPKSSKLRSFLEFTSILISMVSVFLCLILCLKQIEDYLGGVIPIYGGLSFVYLFFYCLITFFDYAMYHLCYYQNFYKSHKGEYFADDFALKFFPNVSISKTFLNEGNYFLYGDTHPSHIQRIIALKLKVKTYFLIINPFYLKYSKTFDDRIQINPRSIYNDLREMLLTKYFKEYHLDDSYKD